MNKTVLICPVCRCGVDKLGPAYVYVDGVRHGICEGCRDEVRIHIKERD